MITHIKDILKIILEERNSYLWLNKKYKRSLTHETLLNRMGFNINTLQNREMTDTEMRMWIVNELNKPKIDPSKMKFYCKNPNCFNHYLANHKIKENSHNAPKRKPRELKCECGNEFKTFSELRNKCYKCEPLSQKRRNVK